MPNRTEPSVPTAENPVWTKDRIAQAKRFHQLSPALQQTLAPSRPRGPQKTPTKRLVSIRLSPDVLEALRATGEGWQTRIDEILRRRFVERRSR